MRNVRYATLLLAVAACGSNAAVATPDASRLDVAPADTAPGDAAPGDTTPGDAAPGDTAPGDLPPPSDGAGFELTARSWLMTGDGLTPADDHLDVAVTAPAGTRSVSARFDDGPASPLTRSADGAFHGSLPAPARGEHALRVTTAGTVAPVAEQAVHVGAALYVIVSADWDESDTPDSYLRYIEHLRTNHPGMVLTQFVGPYVMTDPATTAARKQVLLDWIRTQRAAGDEIGLHIHPRCSFIDTTTVPCRAMPSDVYPAGDPTGYTVILASYTEDEQTTLLRDSADLFVRNGLDRPTSFRAGGWTAQLNTLAACARAGYTVESSAFPPETIQSAWAGSVLASWNLTNWHGITSTSQPYHPSTTNLLSATPAPDLPVLEVPDNGCLVDYMTGPAMIAVLHDNWPAPVALPAPRVFQVGLHPGDFNHVLELRLEQALAEVDLHLYAHDQGPLRYVRLVDLLRVRGW